MDTKTRLTTKQKVGVGVGIAVLVSLVGIGLAYGGGFIMGYTKDIYAVCQNGEIWKSKPNVCRPSGEWKNAAQQFCNRAHPGERFAGFRTYKYNKCFPFSGYGK
ncbi:MAG: hypothetical protein WCW16_00565 [Candidatus Magasanikbacteria bacterium]